MTFKILSLLSPEGFSKRFWEKSKEYKTYKEAYEKLEQDFEKHFGKRRYSDYDSFRVCRDRKLKKWNNGNHYTTSVLFLQILYEVKHKTRLFM